MLPLLFTVFIDSLGFGLVFPIFSPLIVNNEGGMFGDEVTLAMRGLIFGFLVSAYALGQFFGGPVMGALSDRIGRKKVLVGAMALATFGYMVAGVGIFWSNVWLLLVSRILCGVSAGSYPVAQSVIVDTSTKENKAKKLGINGMAFWTGFVIGPFLGGKLAVYGFLVPFLASAIFCLVTTLLLLFFLRETLTKLIPSKVSLFSGIYQIKKAFASPELRGVFSVMFVFCLGWGIFTEFSPVFLLKRFSFGVGKIADFYAWVGLWVALSQGVFLRPILKRFSPERLLPLGLLTLGMVLPVLLLFTSGVKLFILVPIIGLSVALVFPTSATIVSNLSPPESQGESLGLYNSIQWLAIAIPPLFSGSLVVLYPHIPVTAGSVCMLAAFALFLWNFRVKKQEE